MNSIEVDYLASKGFDRRIVDISQSAEAYIKGIFEEISRVREYNQYKVIIAMQKSKLSDTHFSGTTGYGYGDRGREALEEAFAEVFKAEDALVRHTIVSGTHALTLCLFGILRPGDELLSATGKPYDTLEEVIGLRGENGGSLKDFGVSFSKAENSEDGKVSFQNIKDKINEKTKMVLIQRSRGYEWKDSLRVEEIKSIIDFIRSIKKDVVILVDNCYGEFTETKEPIEAGADLVAGSLIKNPGGAIAPTGGYIAGRKKFVEQAAFRLNSPGLGKEVGPTLGMNRLLFQGLFFAPHVVAESMKGAVFCSEIMKRLGFAVSPGPFDKRGDIIQAIKFNNPQMLIAFCQGIQKGSPVDTHVVPEPWDMPGYESPVIMAAGGFVQGASIELSADAPIRPPYIAYMQGGPLYESVKLGVLSAVQNMLDKGMIKI
ncbi:MAG TPA: hypothetical protein GXX49_09070 [Clostridiaceae bacterium]|nr:hypothetical protein [Clostridiaceae bacterium]